MNDFILKTVENLLISYGSKEFEHICFDYSEDDSLFYHFRFEYDNNYLYFAYKHDREEVFDFNKDFVEKIDNIINSYKDENIFKDMPYFVLKQCRSKLCFTEKIDFSFRTDKCYKFHLDCSRKYNNCIEFLADFDNIDLIEVLGAY